jgi:hypothetical protein
VVRQICVTGSNTIVRRIRCSISTIIIGGRVLPPVELINLKFLRQVWLGTKKLMLDTDAMSTIPQRFRELNTKAALAMVLESSDLKQFIPDEWATGKKVSRSYLW